jgi:hypothetical protein
MEGEGAAKEEEIASWEEEANTRMIILTVVNKTRNRTMQLESGFSNMDIMNFISWGGYRVLLETRKLKELDDERMNGFMLM